MTEPSPDPNRLKALEEKLAALRRREEDQKSPMGEHYSQAQHAWRMVIELVSGLLIGFGIGWGLDSLLGTTPWLMAIFTMLGFAAGVKTMIRSARELQDKLQARPMADADDDK
ncbi:AtpZ/AtpI family protein [Rhodobacteraceae bacterium XHP0102]|nr:AtpZ/AtpI family protein [Rhodobacteraceae bacterium XHP0102]